MPGATRSKAEAVPHDGHAGFSARQNAVLETALQLLVSRGESGLTTSGIARAARCSKESLYKWFGDREGLLAALVAYQAGKVRIIDETAAPKTRAEFRRALVMFAEDLAGVLLGDVSLALNRLAIAGAAREGSSLGRALNEHGKKRIENRAKALLMAGRRLGHIRFDDPEEAYQTLYGLIIGDTHIRRLLGDGEAPDAAALAARAETAVLTFERLYSRTAEDITQPRAIVQAGADRAST